VDIISQWIRFPSFDESKKKELAVSDRLKCLCIALSRPGKDVDSAAHISAIAYPSE